LIEEPTGQARFKPGDRVRVRVDAPPRHIRTPAYIQGKTGRIEAVHGAFRNPESRAYGGSGLPKQLLYLVAFDLIDVWGPDAAPPQDKLLIDLYEHWLESV
jgi:nitrile hydratase beta subunit-like protein